MSEHLISLGGYGVHCSCGYYFAGFDNPRTQASSVERYGRVDETLTEHLTRFALAAVPAHTPGALDVERLARAMGSTGECGHSSCPRDTSRHDDEAAAIARAYEAASPSEETR